jgi:hypothetical protein
MPDLGVHDGPIFARRDEIRMRIRRPAPMRRQSRMAISPIAKAARTSALNSLRLPQRCLTAPEPHPCLMQCR